MIEHRTNGSSSEVIIPERAHDDELRRRSAQPASGSPGVDQSTLSALPKARVSTVPTYLYALVLVAAVGVGVLAGMEPLLGVALALAIAFVVLSLTSITAALAVFAVLAFLDTALPSQGSLSVTKLAGLVLVLSWLATVATRHADHRGVFSHPKALYVLLAFVGWAAVSAAWAEEPLAAAGSAFRYATLAFLFLIAYAAIRARRDLLWVVGAFVFGSLVAASFGMFAPSTPEVSGRLSGAVGGANETAAVLVAGLTLAAALTAVLKRKPWLRFAAALSVALCGYGVLLTVSRGALVALSLTLIVSVIVAGRWRAPVAAFALLLAIGAVAYFAVLAPRDARERFEEVRGGTGRTDIWAVGWRMVEDRPLLGVGAANFATSSVHYLLQPGAIEHSEFIVDDPKVAHNIYLHVLAELGLIGLVLFLSIIASSLTCMLKAARAFAVLGDAQMEIIARGVFVAVIGLLAEDFFASEQYSKQLWLLLALGPPMLALARNGARGDGARNAPADSRSQVGWPRPREAHAALPT